MSERRRKALVLQHGGPARRGLAPKSSPPCPVFSPRAASFCRPQRFGAGPAWPRGRDAVAGPLGTRMAPQSCCGEKRFPRAPAAPGGAAEIENKYK